MIHALVKFETTQVSVLSNGVLQGTRVTIFQELKVFTKQGQVVGSGFAEPVVEYLVFEKIGWYDNTWQVRDQIYK